MKTHNTGKKLLALALCLIMAVSLLPVGAMALETAALDVIQSAVAAVEEGEREEAGISREDGRSEPDIQVDFTFDAEATSMGAAPTLNAEDNPRWYKIGDDLSSAGTAREVTGYTQSRGGNEQLIITAEGSMLYIEGTTTLPPLAETTGEEKGEAVTYHPILVTSFRDLNSGTFGGPYIAMEYEGGGSGVYSFRGEKDFSAVADGTYRLYLWRGYSYKNGYYFKMGSSLGVGFMSNSVIVKVSGGQVSILQYNTVLSENSQAEDRAAPYELSQFLDTSLEDFSFANKDPQVTDDASRSLTESEQAYIREVTLDIVSGASSSYEKIRRIYEYVAENLYYDQSRPSNVGTNAACSNPYLNLKALINSESNGYNAERGKVATNCVGYAAMVAAMARSVGIPTRIAEGVHLEDGVTWSGMDDLNTPNHHWTECYVDGRWILVDATLGTNNKYYKNTGEWSYTGLTNYALFDPTDEQIASVFLRKAVYMTNDTILLTGDVNSDGEVTVADLVRLMKYTLNTSVDVNENAVDPNGDGITDVLDVIRLLKYLAGENVTLN